jgi:hypothetical protein
MARLITQAHTFVLSLSFFACLAWKTFAVHQTCGVTNKRKRLHSKNQCLRILLCHWPPANLNDDLRLTYLPIRDEIIYTLFSYFLSSFAYFLLLGYRQYQFFTIFIVLPQKIKKKNGEKNNAAETNVWQIFHT